MHDVHTFERAYNTPSIAICSTAFAKQAIYQAEALGLSEPEKHLVLASHPISDQSADELFDKYDRDHSGSIDIPELELAFRVRHLARFERACRRPHCLLCRADR